jgi:hypothetical protein
MGTLSLTDCIIGAWRDTMRAITAMPILFLMMFCISLAIMRIEHIVHLAVSLSGTGRPPHGVILTSPYFSSFARHGSNIAESILAIPVIRYVIDGETFKLSSINLRVYGRYFVAWAIFVVAAISALAVVLTVQSALQASGMQAVNSIAAVQTLRILLLVGICYLCARSALIFPLIALGGRIQVRAAWRDTRGQVLRVACIYGIGSMLPSDLLLAELVLPLLHRSLNSAGVDLFSEAVSKLATWALGAATLAWIYKRFARGTRLAASTTREQMRA